MLLVGVGRPEQEAVIRQVLDRLGCVIVPHHEQARLGEFPALAAQHGDRSRGHPGAAGVRNDERILAHDQIHAIRVADLRRGQRFGMDQLDAAVELRFQKGGQFSVVALRVPPDTIAGQLLAERIHHHHAQRSRAARPFVSRCGNGRCGKRRDHQDPFGESSHVVSPAPSEAVKELGQAPPRPLLVQSFRRFGAEPVPFFHSPSVADFLCRTRMRLFL